MRNAATKFILAVVILAGTPTTNFESSPELGDNVKAITSGRSQITGARLSSLAPVVEVIGGSATQRAWTAEALANFRSHGLVLPDASIHFVGGGSQEACDGYLGLFDPKPMPPRILICSDLEFVVAHELAHAWTWANLTPEARKTYAQYRGLSSWNDKTAPWRERATEDAAFIIQQVLMSDQTVDSPTWVERYAAFDLLIQLATTQGGCSSAQIVEIVVARAPLGPLLFGHR